MRRTVVALAIGAVALGLPSVATAAGPAVTLGTPSSSGFLKGPFPTLTFQATWEPRSFVTHDITTTLAGAGTPPSTHITRFPAPQGFAAVGGVGQYSIQFPTNGYFDISAVASEYYDADPGDAVNLVKVDGPVYRAGRFGIDSGPPATGTLRLADGASFTDRRTVRASGGTRDSFSGAGYYEIRHDGQGLPGCSRTAPSVEPDGTGCGALSPAGAFETGSFDKEITLPAGPDGLRTVWIVFRDRAQVPCPVAIQSSCRHDGDGNASTPTFDEIVLDTTAPTIALTGGANVTGQAGVPVAFDAGASSDATSGIDPSGFRWDFKDGSPVVENAGPVVAHTYPAPGSYPGEVRGRDRAGNPAVLAFTAVVGDAPPAPAGDPVPSAAAPPATPGAVAGAGAAAQAGGGAPSTPPVQARRPKVLGVGVSGAKAFVNVNDEGVMRVRVATLKGRRLASFTQVVAEGRNRLRVPRRLGRVIPDEGRLVLELQVVADGVAGPVVRRRIDAAALDARPSRPRARAVRP